MSHETLRAARTINAPIDAVFAVLADPTTHQEIDGTGWVRESLDGIPLILETPDETLWANEIQTLKNMIR